MLFVPLIAKWFAHWHIGREIVQELRKGEDRAEYDKQIIKELSVKLNEKYDKRFSSTNLWYFRQFYVVYSNREPKIRRKACDELLQADVNRPLFMQR
ncbi:MAG: DUF1016 N-terminal domain-containing protein [Deltaproteobacteria bacterium]|jgi:hypothetical protein|nr:DUF1016 N-terminal domain-containing protein [Deltaproteobacteria bacterium]MDL1987121.1 DUF1016 N-terminal domain-containing protein [Deltaproteobacteria bacterium]